MDMTLKGCKGARNLSGSYYVTLSLPPARICSLGGGNRSNEGEGALISQRSGNAI